MQKTINRMNYSNKSNENKPGADVWNTPKNSQADIPFL